MTDLSLERRVAGYDNAIETGSIARILHMESAVQGKCAGCCPASLKVSRCSMLATWSRALIFSLFAHIVWCSAHIKVQLRTSQRKRKEQKKNKNTLYIL